MSKKCPCYGFTISTATTIPLCRQNRAKSLSRPGMNDNLRQSNVSIAIVEERTTWVLKYQGKYGGFIFQMRSGTVKR